MIQTINEKAYGKLLVKASPRRIETEEQNERYLEFVESMIDKGSENFSAEDHAIFDLVVTLIEDFESRAYPIPDIPPNERLRQILIDKDLRQKDLISIFGSKGVVSETLNGKREISLKKARELSDFLQVSVELFI